MSADDDNKPLEKYTVTRGPDYIILEYDELSGMLQLPGAVAFGLPMAEWAKLGFTITPGVATPPWRPLRGETPPGATTGAYMDRTAITFQRNGQTIQAIKHIREAFPGTGLAEAKAIVDDWKSKNI